MDIDTVQTTVKFLTNFQQQENLPPNQLHLFQIKKENTKMILLTCMKKCVREDRIMIVKTIRLERHKMLEE